VKVLPVPGGRLRDRLSAATAAFGHDGHHALFTEPCGLLGL
jgi:hypothetical protein